jgi:hypothetical protein
MNPLNSITRSRMASNGQSAYTIWHLINVLGMEEATENVDQSMPQN